MILKILPIVFLISVNSCLYSQTTLEKVKTALLTKRLSVLKNFTDSIGLERNFLYRNVTPEYYEGVLDFMNNSTDDIHKEKEYYPQYIINIIVHESDIIYYKIIGKKLRKKKSANDADYDFVPLDEYGNLLQIKELNTSFLRIFGKSIVYKELFNTHLAFAQKCGLIPKHAKTGEYINLLVKKRKKKEIVKWLQSPNTEKQFYAFEGLYQLHKLGVHLTKSEQRMIHFILNKTGTMYVCNTCVKEYAAISEFAKLYKFQF